MSNPSITEPGTDIRLARARVLARALDSAIGIPGTSIRFGLDPLIGLIPGLGDVAGAALSGYIVLTGIRLGVSRSIVVRMLANIAIDTVGGALPVLGDLFDAGWKSNNMNVALIERHMAAPDATRRASRLMIGGVAIVLLLLALGGVAITVFALRYAILALRR